jgi:hypothetical protein
MINVALTVGELRKDLNTGVPRSTSWAKVADRVPSLRWLLRRHVRDLQLLERLRRGKGTAAPLLQSTILVPPRARRADARRKCRGCGIAVSEHKDRTVLRHHLWILKQRYLAHKSWRGYTPEMKRKRMSAAWAAKRKAVNAVVISTVHPHLVKVFGRGAVLNRMGRLS